MGDRVDANFGAQNEGRARIIEEGLEWKERADKAEAELDRYRAVVETPRPKLVGIAVPILKAWAALSARGGCRNASSFLSAAEKLCAANDAALASPEHPAHADPIRPTHPDPLLPEYCVRHLVQTGRK